MSKPVNGARALVLGAIACIFLMGGCSTPPKQIEAKVFYPAPPDLPRIQFLTSMNGAKDVEGPRSSFETFVTGEKESRRRIDKPYGVAIYEGRIYVCDTNSTVLVFDLNKKTFGPVEGAKGLGKLVQPVNISIDKDGTKYVVDPVRGQIVVFDKDDFYLRAIGTPGLWRPVDAVPYEDRLYVSDMENSEIKVFNKLTGIQLKAFGSQGVPEGLLDRPADIAFDSKGYLYVTDEGRFQVVRFDRDGHYLGTIGKLGTNVGHFQRPRGIAVNKMDEVFVVDAAYFNVQVFTPEDQNLFFFGEGGTNPGKLILPAQIIVDYDNMKYFEQYVDPSFTMEHLIIVTSQFGDRQVNVFAFGKEKGLKYPTNQELLEALKERLLKQLKQQPPEPEGAKEPSASAPAQNTPTQQGGQTEQQR